MRVKRILVTTDLSQASTAAYAHAGTLARKLGARLLLLHIDELLEHGVHDASELAEYLEGAREKREQLIEDGRGALGDYGVDVEVLTRAGAASRVICEVAETREMDLIVMAKQGLRGLSRLLLGSTTRRVLRHLSRPLVVVDGTEDGVSPPEDGAYSKIVAATDFSLDSVRGARHAATLGQQLGATVVLTNVLRLPVLVPVLPGETALMLPDGFRGQMEADILGRLEETCQDLGEDRVEPAVAINAGVAEGLIDQAADADLLVIPSHGKGAVAATFLGSTTESLIKLSHKPVMVLPRSWLAARASDLM